MLKRIWVPFLLLAIVGCSTDLSSDEAKTETNLNTKRGDLVVKNISIESAARQFALNDLNISLQIDAIIVAETSADRFFNADVETKLIGIKTDADFEKLMLAQGMGINQSKSLVSLMNAKLNNFKAFTRDNPQFNTFSSDKQETILTDAYRGVIITNPGGVFTPEPNPGSMTDPVAICLRNRKQGNKDCFEDYCVNAAISILGTVATGGWGLVGVAGTIVIASRCHARVERNYHQCMDDAGQAFH